MVSSICTYPFHMYRNGGLIFTLLLSALLISCGTMRPGSSRSVEVKLLEHYQEWKDTPYVLGGLEETGIDCSGFVMMTMEETFGVKLPRSTREQMQEGSRISKRSLRTGDLIFFQTGSQSYHVGIMVGSFRFIHAASSGGVSMDRIDNSYWEERYYLSRRVI